MSPHLAFARKYRPRTFSEVVGQEAIARALQGAVKNERTTSVYLFAGSHGVGKTSMARILAKALNCPNGKEGEPCLTCPTCESIDRGEALDVLEIDAASNRKIEDARAIRQNVRYKASGMRFKVYILDEAHQLTKEAFDALLKTFEEAPEHVRLILATTELHKVPSTIRSRAQVFHFRRSTRVDLERRLQQILEAEGVALSAEALGLIVRRARGSMRDAQKMLDQVVSLGSEPGVEIGSDDAARLLGAFTPERVQGLLAALARGDAAALLGHVADHFQGGGHGGTFLEEVQDALRAVLYLKTCGPESELLVESSYETAHLAPVAEALSEEGILYALQLLAEVEQKLRIARPREPRILLEVALVRLARARELRPIGEILARLERLEEALNGGGAPASAPTAKPAAQPRQTAKSRAPKARGASGGAGPPREAPQHERDSRRGPPQAQPRPTWESRGGPPPPRRGRERTGYSYPPEMARGAQPAPDPPQPAPGQQRPRQNQPQPAPAQAQRPAQDQPRQPGPSQQPAPAQRPAPAQAPAPAQPRSALAVSEPARAQTPQPTKRELVEEERSARLDQTGCQSAPKELGHLNGATVLSVWKQLRGRLSDSDKLGMTAELIELGEPRVRYDPPTGKIIFRVTLGSFRWEQLNKNENVERLGELFGERLGLGAPAPLELERVEPEQGTLAASAGGECVKSVYEEDIVRLAQRELDARAITS